MNDAENKPLFVIDNDPVIEWPVIVKLPTAGGIFAEHQFEVTMRVLSPAEYEELFQSEKQEGDSVLKISEVVKQNVPVFQRLIVGWKGVKDSAGNEVPFTSEKLAEQVTGPRGPALSAGLWNAVNEIRYGTRLGN